MHNRSSISVSATPVGRASGRSVTPMSDFGSTLAASPAQRRVGAVSFSVAATPIRGFEHQPPQQRPPRDGFGSVGSRSSSAAGSSVAGSAAAVDGPAPRRVAKLHQRATPPLCLGVIRVPQRRPATPGTALGAPAEAPRMTCAAPVATFCGLRCSDEFPVQATSVPHLSHRFPLPATNLSGDYQHRRRTPFFRVNRRLPGGGVAGAADAADVRAATPMDADEDSCGRAAASVVGMEGDDADADDAQQWSKRSRFAAVRSPFSRPASAASAATAATHFSTVSSPLSTAFVTDPRVFFARRLGRPLWQQPRPTTPAACGAFAASTVGGGGGRGRYCDGGSSGSGGSSPARHRGVDSDSDSGEEHRARVAALDSWQPGTTEVQAMADTVTWKYRTSRQSDGVTVWDWVWEKQRKGANADPRVVAEMTRFEPGREENNRRSNAQTFAESLELDD